MPRRLRLLAMTKNTLKNVKENNMSTKHRWIIYLLFSAVFASTAFANSSETAQEIDSYIKGLESGDSQTITRTADLISASGLSHKRLFETVERVLNGYHLRQTETPNDTSLVPPTISLIRALGASGDSRYSGFLYQIQTESRSRAARNRAKHVISKISWYRYRNDVMQDMSKHKPSQSAISTRFLNLLTNRSEKLNRYGAEELYRVGKAEPVVLNHLMNKLTEGAYEQRGGQHADKMAWYCRALIKIDYQSYKTEIDTLSKDRKVPRKIRRHCAKEIKRLGR
ncbi:hypothetical protein ACVBEJ_02195 [Porticoccus sp. GXU_MW_L64]